MDLFNIRNRHWPPLRTPKGIQTISKYLIQKCRISSLSKCWKCWKYRETFAALAFFSSALQLGYWASVSSETEAILKWERTYRPSEKIVEFALGSRGMKILQDPVLLKKMIRSLPASLDETGSIWTSPDLNWVAYYSNEDPLSLPQIHCFDCIPHHPYSSHWQPLGLGWRGLEKVIQGIDRKVKAKTTPISHSKRTHPVSRAIPKDPRALTY